MTILLIALAAGAFLFCMIELIFGRSARMHDKVEQRLSALGRESTRGALMQDSEMNKPFAERVLRPLIKKIVSLVTAILPNKNSEIGEKQKKMLRQAGWTVTSDEYTVIQLFLMVGCGIVGLVIGLAGENDFMTVLLYVLFGMFAAYTILRYLCTSAATRRKSAMEKQLPDLLDLLSVSVAAGLGFERALLHVIETMDGPLVDEFAVTYREMTLGRTRRDALTLLGERCGIEDLSSVTGALVQAGQLGIPICNVLQSQAAAIRSSRRSKVKEKAAKVSTKMLLPMVGLIFPVLILILLGPSIITILEQFS